MSEHETDPILMQALEWFVLMKDETTRDQDQAAFQAWLAADPAHAAAYERAQALWDRFDIVKPEYERIQRSGGIDRRGLLIGGLAALVAGSGLYALNRRGLFADYTTDVAERRTFSLPDGSTVELGSDSALSADFDAGKRSLRLQRGQAFFTVTSDPTRPFIVHAAYGQTRALGTRFDVKLETERVVVSVLEHSVEVTTADANAAIVAAGWQISYGAEGIGTAQEADAGAVEAWRRDRIIFDDVPLRRVLAELERYRRGKIMLMDRSIGDIPVTAVFDTRHTENALQIIAGTLPIRVLNGDGYLAIVYRR
jgi:transmembrane sensor